MKLHSKLLRTVTVLMAVLMLLSMGGGAVAASAATTGTTYVHMTTGEYRDQTIGVYTGEMRNGVPHGEGIIEYIYGGAFQGTFVNGQIKGEGIYVYEEGTYTQGYFTWGTGTLSLDSSRAGTNMSYTGMFCDGSACGFGELTLEQCGTFYGEFFDGEVDGWGIYEYKAANEQAMEGTDWAMVWGSDKYDHVYNGLTLDGKWQGFGIGVMDSGAHYVGEIRNHYRHGYGRLYLAGNKLYQEGIFRKGTLVR